jgi:hypothetical protein
MSELISYGDDEKGFIDILQSMGISDFDPMVPVALNEYAKRKKFLSVFILINTAHQTALN